MSCCICSQIGGDFSNDLLAKVVGGEQYLRRVPIETENFAVIPSLGPLAPGHVILCPKCHYRSFATVPPGHDTEYEHLLANVKEFLGRTYMAPVHLFEHGNARNGTRVLCSVDHAHLHAVPAAVSVIGALRRYPAVQPNRGLPGLRSVAKEGEYIYYESPDGERLMVLAGDHQFESQFMRRTFAEAMGTTNEWNWRDHMKPAETIRTYETLRMGGCEVRGAQSSLPWVGRPR